MSIKNAVRLVEGSEARFVDSCFTDTKDKQHHFTVLARIVFDDLEEWFENGQAFDGSSIGGWKGIQASDMQLHPDPAVAFINPLYGDTTVILIYDVIDPADDQSHGHNPRSIARRAETYLKPSGTGDMAYFGPEPEFFIFGGVRFETDMHKTRYEIMSESDVQASDPHVDDRNTGHRPTVKGGYAPVAPISAGQGLHSAMVNILKELDIEVKVHHAGVDTGSQVEIGTRLVTLVKRTGQT